MDSSSSEDFELLELLGRTGDHSASRVTCGHVLSLPLTEVKRRRSGQAVLLLGPDLSVRRQTAEAEAGLRALLPTEESRRPVPAAAYNVAAQLLAVEAGYRRPSAAGEGRGSAW